MKNYYKITVYFSECQNPILNKQLFCSRVCFVFVFFKYLDRKEIDSKVIFLFVIITDIYCQIKSIRFSACLFERNPFADSYLNLI